MTEEQAPEQIDEKTAPKPAMDPVRKWTFIVLGAALILLVWHLISDRITPYTTQAKIHALVVPIAAQVSGNVTDVLVDDNKLVEAGEILFQIDRTQYQLAVKTAEANLQTARQATGASSASVDVAEAGVISAEAALLKARQDAERMQRIKEEDPGAISVRRIQSAEATLTVSEGQLRSAEANLERARQDLGESGENNARILQAQAALEQARVNLRHTTVAAPDRGLVTNVRVDRGNFASVGAPQMTFVATHNIWIQAEFTENNLGNIKAGDPVDVAFDALPGRIFSGRIRGISFGVAIDDTPLGSLPTIENDRQFLRDEQRFAVLVDFDITDRADARNLRVGAQASVIVYTGDSWLFNTVGGIYVRVTSVLSYAY
ncbi:MAG: HlyD family secretion protein [Gammaproteobacteria bacterium]|nr:HlyD family secretion protein [Gammaproteobacteria bacterium]